MQAAAQAADPSRRGQRSAAEALRADFQEGPPPVQGAVALKGAASSEASGEGSHRLAAAPAPLEASGHSDSDSGLGGCDLREVSPVPWESLGCAAPGAVFGRGSAGSAPVVSGAGVGPDGLRPPACDDFVCFRRSGRPKNWEECPGCRVGPKHPGMAARGTGLSQLPELPELLEPAAGEELECPASGAGVGAVKVAVGSEGFGSRPGQTGAGIPVVGRLGVDDG